MNTILILALFATSITSLSLIEPPGCIIIFIPALIGLITISAMSSNRDSYKPSNVSENMEMDSEWIE